MKSKINLEDPKTRYLEDTHHNHIEYRDYEPIYDIINELFTPSSVADLGCRVGHLISHFKQKQNLDVLGIDYFKYDYLQTNIKEHFIQHDLRDPLSNIINKKYDIIVSTEVAEHIDPDYESIYIQNIKHLMHDKSKLIISWASGGVNHQHFNPKTPEEFKQTMEDYNFLYLEEESYKVFNHFRNNFNIATHNYLLGSASVWQLG